MERGEAVGAGFTGYGGPARYPYSPFADVAVEAPGDFHERAEREAREHLGAVEAAAAAVGVSCDSVTSVESAPYIGIIDVAEREGCDVIFMASHGRRGLGSLLIGSETQRGLTHTKIPVIVYR